eukprot:GSChrysophyteH1.ASY1.ANO1.1353.1 assembled CDS
MRNTKEIPYRFSGQAIPWSQLEGQGLINGITMPTYMMRVLIVGSTDVGKTSLLMRFNDDKFVTNQRTTIGVDYKAKEIDIGTDRVKIQIWDTAGQERFRSMTAAFYYKAQGVILAFDVMQRESFEALSQWLEDIHRDVPEGCCIILCANKVDHEESRWDVKREEFNEFAETQGLSIVETSSKDGTNVNRIFQELGSLILDTGRDNLPHVRTESEDQYTVMTDGGSVLADMAMKKRKKPSGCC